MTYGLSPLAFELSYSNAGLPVYWVSSGESPATKVELIFNAGLRYQDHSFVAKMSVENLFTGTAEQSASELDEAFDLLGAYYSGQAGRDYAYVTAYVLAEQLKDLLSLLSSTLQNAIYPKDLLQLAVENGKSEYKAQRRKAEWWAKRHFNAELLRQGHPLSRLSEVEEYDAIDTQVVQAFHKEFITKGPIALFISGPDKEQAMNAVNKAFDNWFAAEAFVPRTPVVDQDIIGRGKCIKVPGPGHQDAVHVGKMLDYTDLKERLHVQLLNLALGGYFGSRLMQNIREDKGWTYGISSRVEAFGSMDLIQIRSSVKHGIGDAAVDEIFSEIQRLIDQPLLNVELNTIKNTFFGQLQRMVDGSLRRMDALSYLLRNHFTPSHFHEMLALLEGVSPEDLQKAAAKHLKKDDFLAIVVEGQESG